MGTVFVSPIASGRGPYVRGTAMVSPLAAITGRGAVRHAERASSLTRPSGSYPAACRTLGPMPPAMPSRHSCRPIVICSRRTARVVPCLSLACGSARTARLRAERPCRAAREYAHLRPRPIVPVAPVYDVVLRVMLDIVGSPLHTDINGVRVSHEIGDATCSVAMVLADVQLACRTCRFRCRTPSSQLDSCNRPDHQRASC